MDVHIVLGRDREGLLAGSEDIVGGTVQKRSYNERPLWKQGRGAKKINLKITVRGLF